MALKSKKFRMNKLNKNKTRIIYLFSFLKIFLEFVQMKGKKIKNRKVVMIKYKYKINKFN